MTCLQTESDENNKVRNLILNLCLVGEARTWVTPSAVVPAAVVPAAGVPAAVVPAAMVAVALKAMVLALLRCLKKR